MPDFSREDRMPPMSQSSIPSASHTTAPRERRFSGPSDSGAKSARYPGVYQRPPPADYYRAPSPPPQSYRWPPAPPLDEPNYPPRPHSNYHRDSWDYRYRDTNVGIAAPSYSSNRTPPPFSEWGHTHPERGWSPGFGPEDARYARRDWDDRESSQVYSHGWDRPPSPGPPPPRDWQPGLYDRPSAGQPRASPSLMHEPGWREPVPHYDRDMREDWIPPPDDWRNEDPYLPPPEDSYINDPPPPSNMSYGPPRARGRSFAQERRMAQPPPSGYHPPANQLSPRGPAHPPLDNPSRRHPQHDRRYSGGPGYSGDARGYAPRRSYQRGTFNDSHLQNRGAKIVGRDQLLVANPSVKVEENDGSLNTTPGPASASSAHPEKGLAGKRSRTDSVAAEAEPASRRPSPFSSSVATATTVTADPAPATTRSTTVETQPRSTPTVTEQPKTQTVEPPTPVPVEPEPKESDTVQEKGVYAGSNNDSQPAPATTEAPTVPPQSDMPVESATEAPVEETPKLAPDATQTPADDETAMDVEPSASETGPAQPQPDVIPADPSAEQAPDNSEPPIVPATEQVEERNDAVSDTGDNAGDDSATSAPSPMPVDELVHFDFAEPIDIPIKSAEDFIATRQLLWSRFYQNSNAVLAENLKLVSQNARTPVLGTDRVMVDIWRLPGPNTTKHLRNLLQESFQERDEYVENKVGELEEQYLTLHDAWVRNCAKLDLLAEQRRVKDAEAAAAAAQNVVSEPVAAQTRSTRRNPVVNTGVMADAVHSDMEMEKVMNTMRDAAAVDPDILARPNLAKIPDMISVVEPEMMRLTFDDENGQVDNPLEFYDFRGRASEQWTPEERAIFIEHHRVHNKRFEKISEHLPHKTTSQCVQYYYLMKKVPSFRAQLKRGQRRRLGRGGHQGKASALMADIEKEEDGTTASPREEESIATRRPRRHAAAAAAALTGTPPPNATPTESTRGRPRSRVVELARAGSFGSERDGTATPGSVASDSEAGGEGPNPVDLNAILSTQVSRRGGPGRGRRWAAKGEASNGNGGSVRLDGTEPPKKRPATTSYWTVAERTTLKQNLLRHGRDWARIASIIQTKTAIQAKNYYFNNQKEMGVFVKAYEREQAKGNRESASNHNPEGRSEASSSTSAPTSGTKDKKSGTGPVTIQPAPGQSTPTASATGSTTPSKSATGRGSSHYPNVVMHAAGPQQPQWSKNTFPTTKTKPQPSNQPQVIPTPPLPLPGPTFRAWPVSAAPPAPPAMSFFGTFSGVAGPSVAKGNGTSQATTPNVQRTGSVSASVTPSPVSNANPTLTATHTNRGTGGVQRTNVNHYPGPMRYQPYPGPVGSNPVSRGKQMPSQAPVSNGMPKTMPATATTVKLPLPSSLVGKFASGWTGDKVSK